MEYREFIQEISLEQFDRSVMDVKNKDEEDGKKVDWLELPEDLTSHVMTKLISISDYNCFGSVCAKWRSIFIQDYPKISIPAQPPLLMVPTPNNLKNKKKKNKKKKNSCDNQTISCSFYKVTDGKFCNELKIAMPRERYVRGSGHGWLITVDADKICFPVQLMNPFLFYPNCASANREIKLPPLTAHPTHKKDPAFLNYGDLAKAVLSTDPISNPKDVIVMAIFGGQRKLSFCKPGDKAWTPIEDNWIKELCKDLIFYEGKFYALGNHGTVVVCNIEECTTETFAGGMCNRICDKKYLVASAGELFQLHRYVDTRNNTKRFDVFKLQRGEADSEWVEVKNLDDRVFFVGDNPSMSVSSSDFPGCKPNCIYYTDDNLAHHWYYQGKPGYGPRDFGVFNVEKTSFEKHYPTATDLWPAPIWVQPKLIPGITRYRESIMEYGVLSKRELNTTADALICLLEQPQQSEQQNPTCSEAAKM